MLFKEIIAIYSENHMKCINTIRMQNAELIFIEMGGTYSFHGALKT
jgi:hypothetical protein